MLIKILNARVGQNLDPNRYFEYDNLSLHTNFNQNSTVSFLYIIPVSLPQRYISSSLLYFRHLLKNVRRKYVGIIYIYILK